MTDKYFSKFLFSVLCRLTLHVTKHYATITRKSVLSFIFIPAILYFCRHNTNRDHTRFRLSYICRNG